MRVGVEAAAAQHHVAHGVQQRQHGLPRALPRLRIAARQDRRERHACEAELGVSRLEAGAAMSGRVTCSRVSTREHGNFMCGVFAAGSTLRCTTSNRCEVQHADGLGHQDAFARNPILGYRAIL